MPVFWISFTIDRKTIGGRTYDERWQAVYDVADAFKVPNSDLWAQTTSFIVFRSGKGLRPLAATLKASIAPTHDLVLVGVMTAAAAIIIGDKADPAIKKLMPYLIKL